MYKIQGNTPLREATPSYAPKICDIGKLSRSIFVLSFPQTKFFPSIFSTNVCTHVRSVPTTLRLSDFFQIYITNIVRHLSPLAKMSIWSKVRAQNSWGKTCIANEQTLPYWNFYFLELIQSLHWTPGDYVILQRDRLFRIYTLFGLFLTQTFRDVFLYSNVCFCYKVYKRPLTPPLFSEKMSKIAKTSITTKKRKFVRKMSIHTMKY